MPLVEKRKGNYSLLDIQSAAMTKLGMPSEEGQPAP